MLSGAFLVLRCIVSWWRIGGKDKTAQSPCTPVPQRRTLGNNQPVSIGSALNAARTAAGETNFE